MKNVGQCAIGILFVLWAASNGLAQPKIPTATPSDDQVISERLREWTDFKGRKGRFAYVGTKNGSVTLMRRDKTTFRVPLKNLSEGDQAYAVTLDNAQVLPDGTKPSGSTTSRSSQRLVADRIDLYGVSKSLFRQKPEILEPQHRLHMSGNILAVSFSGDGNLLAASSGPVSPDASDRQTVKVWDTGIGKVQAGLDNFLAFFARMSPDGRFLALSPAGKIYICSTKDLAVVSQVESVFGNLNNIDFSPDLKHFAASGSTLTLHELPSFESRVSILDHSPARVLFSPDGTKLATNDNEAVRVFGVKDLLNATQTKIANVQHFATRRGKTVKLMKFSPNGESLITLYKDDRSGSTWDLKTGKKTATLMQQRVPIDSISYFRDGRRILVTDRDRVVTVWDIESRKKLATVSSSYSSSDISSDGKWLVLGNSNELTIWSAVDLQLRTTLLYDAQRNHGWKLSPDSKILATWSGSGKQIKLWSIGDLVR